MSPHTLAFELIPHPSTRSAERYRVAVELTRHRDGLLAVSYVVSGDVAQLRIPAVQAPRFRDELWRHTCCELFLAHADRAAYHEYNFSPSRAWALYSFVREREREPLAIGDIETLDPEIAVSHDNDRLTLAVRVYLSRLSPLYVDAKLRVGVSAVLEDRDGLSYWGLAHPKDTPDFHHPATFALKLDEVRN